MLLQQTGPAVWLEFDLKMNWLKEKTVPVILRSSKWEQTCDNKINSSSLSKSPANNKSSYLLSYIKTCIILLSHIPNFPCE